MCTFITRSTGLAKMILQYKEGEGKAVRRAEDREEWRKVVAQSSLMP